MISKRLFTGQFEWLSALPLLLLTVALAILALGALTGAQSPDARGREALFDFFQRLSPGAQDVGDDFHLVLIDRESVEAVGPWPWPRTILAELVNRAGRAGAKGVILTEAVDAPDPLSPETIGEFWLAGASDDDFARELSRLPRTDEKLADAFATIDGAVAVSATAPADPGRVSSLERAKRSGADWLRINDGGDTLALPAARYFYQLNRVSKNSGYDICAGYQTCL